MNLLAFTNDDSMVGGGVAETTQNGQKLFRAFIHLGRTPDKTIVLEGFGLTELQAIEDCTDKAVTFGKLISTNLSEAFSTRRMELKTEAYREMAKSLGVDLEEAPKKHTDSGDN